jgi:hypothetical protein
MSDNEARLENLPYDQYIERLRELAVAYKKLGLDLPRSPEEREALYLAIPRSIRRRLERLRARQQAYLDQLEESL